MNDKYRRDMVSFDAYYFEKQKKLGHHYDITDTFAHIYNQNIWGSNESVSGVGSTNHETKILQQTLLKVFNDLRITSILDAGCGDFGWLGAIKLPIKYDGFDIVKQNINSLSKQYANHKHINFHLNDFLTCQLPSADLILCRDVLVHLSNTDIQTALKQFKNSGAKYLLTTHFTDCESNEDIVTGDWRTINLTLAPFNLGGPKQIIVEGCAQNDGLYKDKCLALWQLHA